MSKPIPLIIVGGGIAGAAAALRAAQYYVKSVWVRGNRATMKASRGKYVLNVDNMIGVHDGIVRKKVVNFLGDDISDEARERLESTHFHIGTADIVENVVERIQKEYDDYVEILEVKATGVRREEDRFIVTHDDGEIEGDALILATGVMDNQPSIKKTLKSGKVIDQINWIYPYANQETLLYCIRCEGHLVGGDPMAVLGASETTAQIALMFHERYGALPTILTNGETLEINEETQRLLDLYGVTVRTERIVDLLDPPSDPCKKVKKGTGLSGFQLDDGTVVDARFGMISMGLHRVYNDLARELGADLSDEGQPEDVRHVLTDERGETSVRGLFAIGDMAKRRGPAPSMKQIYTAQEFAVRAVDAVERRIRKARRVEHLS